MTGCVVNFNLGGDFGGVHPASAGISRTGHRRQAQQHGRATDELLAELAEAFGVRPGSITLIRGALTPQKVIRITNPQIVPPEIIA